MGRSDRPGMTKAPAALRGRPFVNGNSGRKPGSKNRATLVAAELLEGEREAMLRKAIELALAGNVDMLKFLLGRFLPRERLIKLDLPQIKFADDAVESYRVITHAVCEGQITPNEAAALATLVNSQAKAIDMADVVKRLDSLEAQIKGVPTA
jgi:hypothetical protein